MIQIRVKNLHVRYGKTEAVRGISFEIPRGEIFGFIGPNGAGKSTTIKVLATLLRPSSGRASIGGLNVVHYPMAVRQLIGYMPDYFGVYEDLTAREYLHFFAAAYRIPLATRKGVIFDVLELTGLTDKIDEPVHSLSRGMKQRLALARLLVHDPQVLLLDEPASDLDPRARIEIRELLVALKEMGKTILISSHILSELGQLCTQIGIIEAGRMVAQGAIDDIYRRLQLMRSVHVQLADHSPELIERIRGIDGVAAVDTEVDRISIRLYEDRLSIGGLHDEIHSLGGGIIMFQPEAMDMETAFMKLTTGKVS